ncbi:MAG: HAD hydrolase family protein, partial [Oscillospiraceae bacterium]|nr:HAD hydrolase family protein [Oscillospiraceae bacterium]
MAIFKPTYALRSITEITPAALKKRGIKALILDVDNTLTTHNNPVPAEGISEWIEDMKKNNIKLLIVSNNNAERVTPFAETLGLHFVPNGAKPLPMGFLRAVKE